MKVFDFDKTVYRGDSSMDFYLFVAHRHPTVLLSFPAFAIAAVKYKLGACTVEELKSAFFAFLPRIGDISREVELFWDRKLRGISRWYLDIKSGSDLIISASPLFLISEACKRLGVSPPIATLIDKKSGRIVGRNCKGAEKACRFKARFGDAAIDEFYSDSLTDLPTARLAKRAFLVKRGKIYNWDTNTYEKDD